MKQITTHILKSNIWILLLFYSIVVCFHLFAYIGHFGYDDIQYAKLATDFLHGIYDTNHPYFYRIIPILATAFSYLVFGINDFASALPSLILSFIILGIVYRILKDWNAQVIWLGLTITVSSGWFLFYTDKLMPEMYITTSIFLAIYSLYAVAFLKTNKIVFAFLLVCSLLLGFLSKETIIFIIPVLLYMFVFDVIKKQNFTFWVYVWVFGAVFLLLYFLLFYSITGDAFIRFKVILANSYPNACNYYEQSLSAVLYRVFYSFFELLVSNFMSVGILFCIPIVFISFREVIAMKTKESFFLVTAILLVLSANFMSIYPTQYSPMCLDPRHYLFIVPICAVPASIYLVRYISHSVYLHSVVMLLLGCVIISTFSSNEHIWLLYGLISVIIAVYLHIPHNKTIGFLFIMALSISFFAKPISQIYKSRNVRYQKQKEIYISKVLTSKSKVVVTDDVQKNIGMYYNLFSNSVQIINFQNFERDITTYNSALLYINPYTLGLTKQLNFSVSKFCKSNNYSFKRVFYDNQTEIEIFEISKE